MPSLVPEFIINPVLRQARQLSSNFSNSGLTTPLENSSAQSAALTDSSVFDDDETTGPPTKERQPLKQQQQAGSLAHSTNVWGSLGLRRIFSTPAVEPSDMIAAIPSSSRVTFPQCIRTSSLQTELEQEYEDSLAPESATADASSNPATQGQMRDTTGGLDEPFVGGADLPINGEQLDRPEEGEAGTSVPLSLPTGFFGNVELPEDDGMQALRRRILAVQSRDIVSTEKARLIHGLLMENYKQSQKPVQLLRPQTPTSLARALQVEGQPQLATTPSSSSALGTLETLKFWHAAYNLTHSTPTLQARPLTLTEADLQPTYVPDLTSNSADGDSIARDEDGRKLYGCEHYRRNVKLQCYTCERWYTCRLCHNDAEDHTLPRSSTRNMLCMLCGYAQRAGAVCAKCGESAARYYCGICKLWNDDPDKSIYHCSDCGICRVGEGLGKDFFHCKKCGSCIAINQEESHRCREGVMDCDCPICSEYIFTTHKKVVTMKCGHMIHDDCRAQYIKRSYKCPICNKSVENMESMFRRLDKHLEEQPMPEEYANTRAVILCNDCEAKTSTSYHWGGLRCEVCLSYNTVELLLLNPPATHNGQSDLTASDVVDSAGTTAAAAAAVATLAASTARTLADAANVSAHSTSLPPKPLPLSPQLPPSLLPDPGNALMTPQSPPKMSFRSASPAYMTSHARAPVLATAPPGYSEEGFELEGDEDDYCRSPGMEDGDIFGLFDRAAALSWGRRTVSPYFGGGKKDDDQDLRGEEDKDNDDGDDDDDDDDDDDNEDKKDEDADEDDEDEDEDEDEIQLLGHR
ncbi:hypothetical protein SEPCBS57363_002309 [Sporothrix epigloea]|uniref:Chy and ring finger domain protein n=1 Tax=Sporothrix epigloea TaxID=1892477 RepID=A0ABP0DF61_9PEZI